MTKVRSLSTAPIALVKRDGTTETIRPNGEEHTVSYDPNNEHNIQMFAMGAVEEVDGSSSAASSRKAAPKRAPRSRKPAAKKVSPEASDTSAGE